MIVVAGLRVSHFHDDKHSPLDPMQKTLTSFLTIGNVAPIADKSTGFDTSDIHLMYNTKSDISVDDESTFLSDVSSFSYESCDFLETSQLSVPDYVTVSFGNEAESLNECPKTQNKVIYFLLYSHVT